MAPKDESSNVPAKPQAEVKVVIGLGNPGNQYRNTPHNMGFALVDEIARRLGCRLRRSIRCRALIGNARHGNNSLLLVKPQTFVNLSGLAANAVLRRYKLLPSAMIVVMDDANLDVGFLRIRGSGSSGGHKGLQSVIEACGTDAFTRVRIGVGRAGSAVDLARYVLTRIGDESKPVAEQTVRQAADAVLNVIERGEAAAMNKYNRKMPASPAEEDGEASPG